LSLYSDGPDSPLDVTWRGVSWCDEMRREWRDVMVVDKDNGCGAVWGGEKKVKNSAFEKMTNEYARRH
jgi:hypothetical protein